MESEFFLGVSASVVVTSVGFGVYFLLSKYVDKRFRVEKTTYDPMQKAEMAVGDELFDARGGELCAKVYEDICTRIRKYLKPKEDGREKKYYKRVRFIAGSRLEVYEEFFKKYRNKKNEWHMIHPVLALLKEYPDRVELYFATNGDAEHFALGDPSLLVGVQEPPEGGKITFTQNDKTLFKEKQEKFDRQIAELKAGGRKWDGDFSNPQGLRDLLEGFDSYEKRLEYDSFDDDAKKKAGKQDEYVKLEGHVMSG